MLSFQKQPPWYEACAAEKLRSQDLLAAFLMVFIFDTQPWT